MALFASKYSAGRVGELGPVLLLLLVVAVPTIGVLWFVGVAVENQQLATKQRLTEAYQSNLQSVRSQLELDWQKLQNVAEQAASREAQPRGKFLEVLAHATVDSAVCVNTDGHITYPRLEEIQLDPRANDERWAKAIATENALGNPAAAQLLYATIAEEAKDQRSYALALQGQVRCLLKSNKKAAAIDLVIQAVDDRTLGSITDPAARHAIANVELMAVENTEPGPRFDRIWHRLYERIFMDIDETLPGPQRLFILRRMAKIAPNEITSKRLLAEDLASNFVSTEQKPSRTNCLSATSKANTWMRTTEDGRLHLLFTTATINKWATLAANTMSLPASVQVDLIPPTSPSSSNPDAVAILVGKSMPGWQLQLSQRDGPGLSDVSEGSRIHIWTAALVVLFSSVLGIAIARAFQHKLRVADLKNDLVGTVSHELKTPLASMRLLVDTLLNEQELDESTTREYLQLISKENVRLSRLIENFLTFSRMEQDRHTFQFEDVPVAEVIREAVDSMGDRLTAPSCHFTQEIAENLPDVWGDHDGLVTVFLNLLDNAYKYSSMTAVEPAKSRRITVTAEQQTNEIVVTVTDNGIGLSKVAAKRIFERFYQVDQSLIRKGHGCGLGLSIVDYIVQAHGGTIHVTSGLGKGSQFCVRLPISPQRQQEGSDDHR